MSVSIADYRSREGPVWFGLAKSGLEILSTLTANYGVKQSQFTKSTLEPYARNPEVSNEVFDRMIRE